MTINGGRVHEEQSDIEEEQSEDDVLHQAQPEALIVDVIDVHVEGIDSEDPGFFQEYLDFWANLWSFVPVSPLKSPLLLYDTGSS